MQPKLALSLAALLGLSPAAAFDTVSVQVTRAIAACQQLVAPQPEAPPAPTVEAPAPEPEPAKPATPALTASTGLGVLHIPAGVQPVDGQIDLVIHYHGALQTIAPAFDSAKINAALLVINLGTGSEVYERPNTDPGALSRTLQGLEHWMAGQQVAGGPKIGRVALSCWSAGCGAVARILRHPASQDRVDAALLADGMHAPFGMYSGKIEPVSMKTHIAFALRAMAGDKLMAVSHSEVETYGYASTTQTATFLSHALELEPRKVQEPGPRSLTLQSRTDSRGLHILGYTGGNAAAHNDHLFGIADTLYPSLRSRWESR